eukprot:494713-Alexandrium_andersonii.AAC.1
MSASLVGSEMCIRDRPDPAWPSEGWHRCERPRTAAARIGGALCVLRLCCLLYTSDAADDM